jgi:hypothetical protein
LGLSSRLPIRGKASSFELAGEFIIGPVTDDDHIDVRISFSSSDICSTGFSELMSKTPFGQPGTKIRGRDFARRANATL